MDAQALSENGEPMNLRPQEITFVNRRDSETRRHVKFSVGQVVTCVPSNPRAKKNRGRVGTIEGFEDHYLPGFAFVRWECTGRQGKSDLGDLHPVKPKLRRGA